MAKSNTPAKKTPAKRSTTKHKRRLDRLTPEQRKRVLKYASALKGNNHDDEQKRNVLTPTSTKSLRPAIKIVHSAPAKMKSMKDPSLSAGTKSSSMGDVSNAKSAAQLAKRDPPPVSYAHLHLSEGVRRTATKPTTVNSTKSFNPLPITRSAQDPPCCDANQMQIQKGKSPSPENDQLGNDNQRSTSFEASYSGWNLLRRGLQAIIGLADSDGNVTGNGASDVVEEIFYDAVEFAAAPAQQHLVEDVSDEDEDICNLRRRASLNVPGDGESWIEPVDSPLKGNTRRFAKPDP